MTEGGDPFAAIAAEYEAWYATPLGGFVIAEEECALLAALPPAPCRVVEVGAGTGWWARRLAARGDAVVAVEPSAAMRRIGEERGGGIEWVAAPGERLPLDDATADVALVMTVLEFAADPGRVLAESWRIVRPGGSLVVGHLDPLSPWAALYRHLGDAGMAPWDSARFIAAGRLSEWMCAPPESRASCAFLAPAAAPPFEAANEAGRAAGNAGALEVLCWRKAA